jgi:hypothetical protein
MHWLGKFSSSEAPLVILQTLSAKSIKPNSIFGFYYNTITPGYYKLDVDGNETRIFLQEDAKLLDKIRFIRTKPAWECPALR